MSSFSVIGVSSRLRAGRFIAAATLAVIATACGANAPTAPSNTISAAPVTTTTSGGGAVGTAIGSAAGATYVPGGNYTCSDLAAQYAPGSEWFEVKLDRAPGGSHEVGDVMLTANIANGSPLSFDWSSNIGVDAVFVKSGTNGSNLYIYGNESTGATGLTTPVGQDISHVSFCYDIELVVSKTVSTSFKRDFDWTLVKSVDKPSVTLESGAEATVNYTVAATKNSGTDSDWTVAGTIDVTNPHKTLTASGVSLVDTLTNHGTIVVACPSNSLAPLAKMTCSYGAVSLSSGVARTNTGVADSTTYGIVKGEGSVAVNFVTPTSIFDNAVNVTDSYSGAGVLASGLTASRTFNYARTILASQLTCGANTIANTASLATDDGATRTASANVTATLTCATVTPAPEPAPAPAPPTTPLLTGCAYSQGYWSTHSSQGPASYNNTWAKLGENTIFYLSGQTNYSEMHVNPKGNAYHTLAQQYIAARLNVLAGAPAPAGVDMNAIDAFYKKYTPAQIDAMKGNDPIRKQALEWSSTLDSFNNGKLNASHCN
jgi:hypothetical protein